MKLVTNYLELVNHYITTRCNKINSKQCIFNFVHKGIVGLGYATYNSFVDSMSFTVSVFLSQLHFTFIILGPFNRSRTCGLARPHLLIYPQMPCLPLCVYLNYFSFQSRIFYYYFLFRFTNG